MAEREVVYRLVALADQGNAKSFDGDAVVALSRSGTGQTAAVVLHRT